MRHLFWLLLSFVLLHGVRASPLEERQILDPLKSFVTSLLDIEPTPTPTSSADDTTEATSTAKAKDPKDPKDAKDGDGDTDEEEDEDEDKEEDEDVTTIPWPAVRTSTSNTSSEPTSTTTSSSVSSTTTPTTSTSPTPIPTNPLNAEATPSSSKGSSGGITPAGIAVAVIMSFAILIAIFVVVWKFHPKVVAWRKRKAYERMQERSYRPALDGPFPGTPSSEKGLGISNVESSRPLSFFALAAPRVHKTIRRKPVPVAEYPIVEMPKLEKELPPRPDRLAAAHG